mgnify:CR=1 FL=1
MSKFLPEYVPTAVIVVFQALYLIMEYFLLTQYSEQKSFLVLH